MFKFNFDLDDLVDDPELNAILDQPPPSDQLPISNNHHSLTETPCKQLSLEELVRAQKNFFFGYHSDSEIKDSLTHYLPPYPALPSSYLSPTARKLSLLVDEIFSMHVFN